MKINHINLTVSNVLVARQFLEKYFDLRCTDGTKDNATFIALRDNDGFVLTIMQSKDPGVSYPATFHIGFLQQGPERTNEIYQRLLNDGFDVKPPGHYHKDELYINTPFGITIQVS